MLLERFLLGGHDVTGFRDRQASKVALPVQILEATVKEKPFFRQQIAGCGLLTSSVDC